MNQIRVTIKNSIFFTLTRRYKYTRSTVEVETILFCDKLKIAYSQTDLQRLTKPFQKWNKNPSSRLMSEKMAVSSLKLAIR